jgi:hypothetical protein
MANDLKHSWIALSHLGVVDESETQRSRAILFTPIFLKSNSASSNQLALRLSFLSLFLVCHPVASYNPAAIHPYNTPSHANLRALVTVTIPGYLNLLTNFLSKNHFRMVAHTFFSRFSFPVSSSIFPFYSLGSVIRHHRSPLAYSL